MWGAYDRTFLGKGLSAQAVAWTWGLIPLLHLNFPFPGPPRAFLAAHPVSVVATARTLHRGARSYGTRIRSAPLMSRLNLITC